MNNYTHIVYENNTINMELISYSDENLIQEVQNLLVNYNARNIEEIVTKYIKNGKLSKEDRNKLENFYKLINLQYGFHL